MEIAKRDQLIENMKLMLKEKQRYLFNQYKELNSANQENEFLVGVKDDYKKYYDYIKMTKQSQYDALKKISEYLDKIASEITTTDLILQETKKDQKTILGEMENIKSELNQIIDVEK